MNNTKKMVRLAFLLAVSVLLHYIESVYLQLPSIAPGVKIGIANLIGLIVLSMYGVKDFLLIGFLRILLTALMTTGFGSAFWISMSGWVFSSLVVFLLFRFSKCSIFGISVVSALFHGIGQIFIVCLLYNTVYMLYYLPILSIAGIIAGILVAFLTTQLLSRIEKIMI